MRKGMEGHPMDEVGASPEEEIRKRFSIGKEAFEHIRLKQQEIADILFSQTPLLSGHDRVQKEGILLHKLALFLRGQHGALGHISAHEVAMAISHHPALLDSRATLGIKDALDGYRKEMKQTGGETWERISSSEIEMPMIGEYTTEDKSHYLSRLFTRGHLVANSEALNHCIGRKSLNRYFDKSRRREVEVFSMFDFETHVPAITIVFDAKAHEVVQIRKLNDELLTGEEPFFAATIECLKYLMDEEGMDDLGRPYKRNVKTVRDLEKMLPERPHALTAKGNIVPIEDASNFEIVGGSTLRVEAHLPETQLVTFAEQLPITIDLTGATDGQRQRLVTLRGSLVDDRPGNLTGYANLERIAGQLVVQQAADIRFPKLASVERGVYANAAARARFDALKTVGGRFVMRGAKEVVAPQLESVAGHIELPMVDAIDFPKLQKVGWHIIAPQAVSVTLPEIEKLGGSIQASPVASIETPKLK